MHEATLDRDPVRDGRLRPAADDNSRLEAFLPSDVPQTHAANLMPLADGDLGCVWFAGTQEGLPDVSIWFSRLKAGADTWSAPQKLSDDPTRSEQNPVLFPAPDGRLFLFYTAQLFGNQDTSIVRCRISHDNGRSWGPIAPLFEEEGVFVRQPVIVLDNGDWLLPVFLCRRLPGRRWDGSNDVSAVRISSDQGRSWSHHEVPDSLGAVHMNVVKQEGGRLLAFFRSRWADRIYLSRSAVHGRSWSAPVPTALPNNNSSIQVKRLASGRLALVYNHISAADSAERRASLYDEIDDGAPPDAAAGAPAPARAALWGVPRAPLSLALSDDEGESWRRRDIERGDGSCLTNNTKEERRNRELSYPTLAEGPDGTLHVAYTWRRRAIRYVRLPESWVGAG